MENKEITTMLTIGGFPYITVDEVAKEIHKTKRTVDNRLNEMQGLVKSGRYSEYAIIQDEGIKLVNAPCFIDFLKYRKALQDHNVSKHVPLFNPEEIMKICGWSSNVIHIGENFEGIGEGEVREIVREELEKLFCMIGGKIEAL